MVLAICVIVIIVFVLVYWIFIRKKSINAETLFDDQLVVDKLEASDLKSWFGAKNSEKKYTAIAMIMNEENLKKYHLNISIESQNDKCLVQCLYDSNIDSIVCGRVIIYNSMGEKLANILNKCNGIVIFD